MKRPNFRVTLLSLALLGGGDFALAQETILRGRDLNEKNLIEALTPNSGGVEEVPSSVRTRSIKVMREQPAAKPGEATVKQAVKKASASLLVTFTTNSTDLTEETKASLDVVAKALQADKLAEFAFSIEGHADPRGNPDDNLRLSQGRAESVVNYLVAQHHIDPARLKPVGKGATELANTERIDAPENRRVTITTLKQ
jgi:outer membrane protein OmpA-like peptidoglycan-associated protein